MGERKGRNWNEGWKEIGGAISGLLGEDDQPFSDLMSAIVTKTKYLQQAFGDILE